MAKAKKKALQRTYKWRSRIVKHGEKPASEFLANPQQWKIHPKAQERALISIFNKIGWVQSVVENARTGHLLDGHLRVQAALEQGDETPVPYIEVDISEKDEALMLAFLDRVTERAGTDDEQYDALLAGLADVSDDVAAILVRSQRKPAKGLSHSVKECQCCKHGCVPGCGCYREPK